MRRKDCCLTLKAMNCTMDQGLLEKPRDIIGEKSRGKIIGAIDEHIVSRGDGHRVFGSESHAMKIDFHMRIDLAQSRGRTFEFGFSDPRLTVQDLAVEVGYIDHIVIEGGPDRPAAWSELTALCAKTWRHASGTPMQTLRLGVDTGYEAPAC